MASSITTARAHLFTLLTNAFTAQVNVEVYMGNTLSTYVSPVTVQITGWTGDQQPADLSPGYKREETFAINMLINSWAGDQDYASRETEVMNAFGIVAVTVNDNYELPSAAGNRDGVVRFAEVGSFDFKPHADMPGMSMGELTFSVHCTARITSLT